MLNMKSVVIQRWLLRSRLVLVRVGSAFGISLHAKLVSDMNDTGKWHRLPRAMAEPVGKTQ